MPNQMAWWLNGNPFTRVPCDWGVNTAVTTNLRLPTGVSLANCEPFPPSTSSPTISPTQPLHLIPHPHEHALTSSVLRVAFRRRWGGRGCRGPSDAREPGADAGQHHATGHVIWSGAFRARGPSCLLLASSHGRVIPWEWGSRGGRGGARGRGHEAIQHCFRFFTGLKETCPPLPLVPSPVRTNCRLPPRLHERETSFLPPDDGWRRAWHDKTDKLSRLSPTSVSGQELISS